MHAIDTNIWIYCHDNRDPVKRGTARDLIAGTRPLALPWQVGCEFIAAARKLAPFGFDVGLAWQSLETMHTMANALLLPAPTQWQICKSLMDSHQIAFWDGLLLASCIEGGVHTLYSEDFGGSESVEGVRIVNPFR